uniref:Uncharacterized protein n=1 Tax=Cacopsylla melanoneura TaxID=428564 RepID=A0A8D8VTL1_9HEMI
MDMRGKSVDSLKRCICTVEPGAIYKRITQFNFHDTKYFVTFEFDHNPTHYTKLMSRSQCLIIFGIMTNSVDPTFSFKIYCDCIGIARTKLLGGTFSFVTNLNSFRKTRNI